MPDEPEETTSDHARRTALATGAAVLVGMGIAGQARVNGQLAAHLADGLLAALVSFTVGLVILVVLALVLPRVRRGPARVRAALRGQRLRPWHLLGGVCGAALVLTQGLTVGVIGVAVFVVAVVAGQTVSSLVVDRLGIGPGGPQPVTVARVLGALLAMVAVVASVADRFAAPSSLALALLPALAGLGLAWQQAVNGRVGVAAGGPLGAALVNFAVGTVALLLAAAVDLAVRGLPRPLPTDPLLYLGGPIGVLFIGAAAAIVPITGVLLLGLGSVAGQVVGAVLLDVLVPAQGEGLTVFTLSGAVLTLVAVGVATLPGRRRTARARPSAEQGSPG